MESIKERKIEPDISVEESPDESDLYEETDEDDNTKVVMEDADNFCYGSEQEYVKETLDDVGSLCKGSERDYVKEMISTYGKYKPFTEDQEKEIFSKIVFTESGDIVQNEVYQKIVMHNMRLVLNIAGKYKRRLQTPLEDLIHDGTIGLMKAIKKFKLSKGVRFSTYAIWWINQAIKDAYKISGRPVKTPASYDKSVSKYLQMENELRHDLGRAPSIAEVAGELNMSIKVAERICMYIAMPISLDVPTNASNSGDYRQECIVDKIRDDSCDIDKQIEENEIKEQVDRLIQDLTPKEQFVTIKKYGLDGNTLTDKEISEQLGITKNQVRSIVRSANKKMYRIASKLKLNELIV